MTRLASTLILAAATGALLTGAALAQSGPGDTGDAQLAEHLAEVIEPCYAAPAEAHRTTVTLVANGDCDALEASARERDASAAGDDAPAARQVGPLVLLP